ncbi:unnamed protein product, partial [Symbiodinium sp. CCMP2456]
MVAYPHYIHYILPEARCGNRAAGEQLRRHKVCPRKANQGEERAGVHNLVLRGLKRQVLHSPSRGVQFLARLGRKRQQKLTPPPGTFCAGECTRLAVRFGRFAVREFAVLETSIAISPVPQESILVRGSGSVHVKAPRSFRVQALSPLQVGFLTEARDASSGDWLVEPRSVMKYLRHLQGEVSALRRALPLGDQLQDMWEVVSSMQCSVDVVKSKTESMEHQVKDITGHMDSTRLSLLDKQM